MNKLLILQLCLLFTLLSQAQNKLDSNQILYANLFHLDLPHQVLIDIYPGMADELFAQAFQNDSLQHAGVFRHTLHVLRSSSKLKSTFPSADSFNQRVSSYRDRGIVPIGLIDYGFTYLNDSAYQWPGLSLDTTHWQLNASDSLLQFAKTAHTTKIAVFDQLFYGNIQFIIPSSLFFSNRQTEILEIDFGDGSGYRSVRLDEIISVHYSDSGLQTSTTPMRIKLGNGETEKEVVIKTEQILQRDIKPDYSILATNMNIAAPCFDFDAESTNEALISVRYGKNNARDKKLRNPIILIEGFDYDLNPNDQRFGDINYLTLRTGISTREIDGKPIHTNLEHMPELIDQLYKLNYDIIFINFKNGSADLHKNGNTVIRVIQWVNENKTGENELVLMGASMGGVLARYALVKMEELNCNHCTKLNCSFDAPHRGAHVPYGIQIAINAFVNRGLTDESSLNPIRSIAAQQMLVNNIIPGSPEIHLAWQQWLERHGHPKFSKNIAITNGSPSGSKPVNPKDLIYRNTRMGGGIKLFEIELYAEEADGYAMKLIHPSGRTNIGNWLMRAFGFSQALHYRYPDYLPNYDHASGGQAPWLAGLDEQLKLTLQQGKPGKNNTIVNEGFNTFVAVYSALDFYTIHKNPNLTQLIPYPDVASSIHPFDAVFYPSSNLRVSKGNQEHVYIDPSPNQAVDWLVDQIESMENRIGPAIPADPMRITFNYNKQNGNHSSIHDLTIHFGGRLILNGQSQLNYQQAADPFPSVQGDLQLFRTSQCGSDIIVESGGVLQLGEELGSITANNKAAFTVLSGSTIHLKAGKIVIHNGSSLIIEHGAELIIEQGAQIELQGPDAKLVINGQVVIGQSAVFTLATSVKWDCGQLILNVTRDNQGKLFHTTAPNASIDIQGVQAYRTPQIVISGGPVIVPFSFQKLKLKSTKLSFFDKAQLVVDCPVEVESCTFYSDDPSQGCTALNISGTQHANIKASQFTGLAAGIDFQETNGLQAPIINYCIFRDCGNGVSLFNGKLTLSNTHFITCSNGLSVAGNSSIQMSQSSFDENGTACLIFADQHLTFESNNCRWSDNNEGIWSDGPASLVLECALFEQNHQAIQLFESTLILCPLHPDAKPSTGQNTFEDNDYSIQGFGQLYIDQGNNNFIKQPTNTNPFIDILLPAGCTCINGGNLPAAHNYWAPFSGASLSAATGLYRVEEQQFPHPVQLLLSGPVLTSKHEACLNTGVGHKDTNDDNTKDKVTALPQEKRITTENIYPNPADQYIYIPDAYTTQQGEYLIYSMLGNIFYLKNSSINKREIRLNVSELPNGYYIIDLKGIKKRIAIVHN